MMRIIIQALVYLCNVSLCAEEMMKRQRALFETELNMNKEESNHQAVRE